MPDSDAAAPGLSPCRPVKYFLKPASSGNTNARMLIYAASSAERNLSFNPFFIISNTVNLNMKKSAFIPALMLFAALAFTACKKDDVKTLEEQATGAWASQSVRIDGADASLFFTSNLSLNDNGTFSLKVITTNPFTGQTTTTTDTGNWRTNEETQTITLNFDNSPTQEWKITTINQNSLTAQYTDLENHQYVITFAKQ